MGKNNIKKYVIYATGTPKMVECKICGYLFRDNYKLNRHMSRIKPCTPKNSSENNDNSVKTSNNCAKTSENCAKTSNNCAKTSNNCIYCLSTFANKYNLNLHKNVCKYRDDPVRLLEIENDICPEPPESKTECRFCNNNFFNVSNLNKHVKVCKERKDYHQKLLKQKKVEIHNTTINNTNNGTINNNNNTININVFGQESLDHISNDDFMKYLLKNFKKYDKLTDQTDINTFSGNFVLEFDRMMSENPENRNALLTNIKAEFGIINNRHYRFEDFVQKVLSNAAKKLSEREDLFSENSDKDISFSSLMMSDAREYTSNYRELPKKQLKQLTDSIRIQKT